MRARRLEQGLSRARSLIAEALQLHAIKNKEQCIILDAPTRLAFAASRTIRIHSGRQPGVVFKAEDTGYDVATGELPNELLILVKVNYSQQIPENTSRRRPLFIRCEGRERKKYTLGGGARVRRLAFFDSRQHITGFYRSMCTIARKISAKCESQVFRTFRSRFRNKLDTGVQIRGVYIDELLYRLVGDKLQWTTLSAAGVLLIGEMRLAGSVHITYYCSYNEDNEDNDQNILYDNVYESGAPTVTFQCNRKAVNSVLNIQEENDRSGVLPWPILDPVPINEFTCDGYICRAFPTLFPTGKENEEDYEVINTVQIEQLHDWMEVAAGPQNINQEDDLGFFDVITSYKLMNAGCTHEKFRVSQACERERGTSDLSSTPSADASE
ncbi:hypothetical protein EVAR_5213_1 [Eumeta japonica]|uniref:Uncharacterized protein n=1 Tax=Eumeta variegata TaxID=151549 RepID=A0A4C1V370_EUMVA|nr:hypothetical protein EVAR_5213_1 [Eumeta japonica]